jgi:hypothetical protein
MFPRAAYAVSADLKAHGPGDGPTTAARKAARVMVNRRETKVAQIRPTGRGDRGMTQVATNRPNGLMSGASR